MNTVPIELDKPRQLRYTWGSLKRLRDEGIILEDLDREELGDPSVFVTLLWAGLAWEDPTLTLMQAGDLVDIERTQEVVDLLGKALVQDREPGDPSEATV